ncbi:MAG: SUMF1/EgtB/PvdO family nonheme iron enzyme [Verrucomicrobia bacterium]|nr:SUMF1/EgtB/PvdO family nonheme iron enzyme [Verrucomicrobiota bacterium]
MRSRRFRARGLLAAVVVAGVASAAPWQERLVTLTEGVAFTFVQLPAGRFVMGSPDNETGRARDEGPQREVTLSQSFWLGKYEVTQAQWLAVMKANPATFQDYATSEAHPVEGVSWLDVQEFVARLNTRGLGRFRLPTEAEWEYAARAGSADRFPWGEDRNFGALAQHAWFYPRAEGRSHPVGGKQPNPWGLHDLFGGVWEWCADWYAPYPSGPAVDPQGPAEGTDRCIRGGSWFNEPEALRSANRHRHPPESRQTNLGLRLVWEPPAGGSGATFQRRSDGSVPYGYRAMPSASSGPWFVPVPGHVPVAAGEHPRLLFRRTELAALRAKAATPEGRAMLQRLRLLLSGGSGEGPPAHFIPATAAYPKEPLGPAPPGTFTVGHAAGYGLLYQLTGDSRFADWGRECFERALAGTRDRDPRYSFRRPGGALRAGPTLGWLAVGYDLCYDGWSVATRERFGRALAEYHEVPDEAAPRGPVTLESLARGTMPPYSNHFGMQVGGAALALLAVRGEPWTDHSRVEELLTAAAHGLIRNLDEGFGDGGFFAEGDGTGSMASQIVFLSALQAWRSAAGLDFFSAPRPNARLLTLKWIYQTVFREGRPEFWPVRGGYPQNVWSRTGMSGAAYFALGMGSLPPAERGALLWCYQRFLAAADARAGTPFDTASVYPQYAVSAFVSWPVGEPAVDPRLVLPHVYRDSVAGFFCWRDRWQDEDDTVVTLLTNPVRGYMGAPADRTLAVQSRGRRLSWGTVAEGPVREWAAAPRGESSTLTLADGTAFAVDFTGASGADLMLVTTGPAEGQTVRLGATPITLWFPTAASPPRASVAGNAIAVGLQQLTLLNGNLRLQVTTR